MKQVFGIVMLGSLPAVLGSDDCSVSACPTPKCTAAPKQAATCKNAAAGTGTTEADCKDLKWIFTPASTTEATCKYGDVAATKVKDADNKDEAWTSANCKNTFVAKTDSADATCKKKDTAGTAVTWVWTATSCTAANPTFAGSVGGLAAATCKYGASAAPTPTWDAGKCKNTWAASGATCTKLDGNPVAWTSDLCVTSAAPTFAAASASAAATCKYGSDDAKHKAWAADTCVNKFAGSGAGATCKKTDGVFAVEWTSDLCETTAAPTLAGTGATATCKYGSDDVAKLSGADWTADNCKNTFVTKTDSAAAKCQQPDTSTDVAWVAAVCTTANPTFAGASASAAATCKYGSDDATHEWTADNCKNTFTEQLLVPQLLPSRCAQPDETTDVALTEAVCTAANPTFAGSGDSATCKYGDAAATVPWDANNCVNTFSDADASCKKPDGANVAAADWTKEDCEKTGAPTFAEGSPTAATCKNGKADTRTLTGDVTEEACLKDNVEWKVKVDASCSATTKADCTGDNEWTGTDDAGHCATKDEATCIGAADAAACDKCAADKKDACTKKLTCAGAANADACEVCTADAKQACTDKVAAAVAAANALACTGAADAAACNKCAADKKEACTKKLTCAGAANADACKDCTADAKQACTDKVDAKAAKAAKLAACADGTDSNCATCTGANTGHSDDSKVGVCTTAKKAACDANADKFWHASATAPACVDATCANTVAKCLETECTGDGKYWNATASTPVCEAAACANTIKVCEESECTAASHTWDAAASPPVCKATETEASDGSNSIALTPMLLVASLAFLVQ